MTAEVTEDGAPALASARRTAVVGTFGTMAALVTAQASVAIALLVLARRTDQAPFGSYIGLYAASLSVGALLDFGSSQLRTRELARGHGRTQFRSWLLRRSTIQLPAVALFAAVALVLIGDDLPALCILGLVAQALTYNLAQGSMAAVRSTRSPVLAEWLFAVGNVVLLVACVVAPSTSLLSAAGLAAAGTWLATAAAGLWATRHLVGGRRPSRAVNPWAGAASFGVSSFSISLLGFSIAVITWTSGNEAAAEIGAVNKWGQPIVLFAAAYASYMFPAFASAPSDRRAVHLLRPLRLIAGLGALVALVVIAMSTWLVDNLLPPEYADSDTLLRLLVLAAVPVLVAQPLASMLQARGDDGFVARLFVGVNLSVFTGIVLSSFALGAMSIPICSLVGSSVILVALWRRTMQLVARRAAPAGALT